MRHHIAVYIEKMENFCQIRTGNAKEFEQFSDLLVIARIKLGPQAL